MWLHHLALVAHDLSLRPLPGSLRLGNALAGVAFTLCGFQMMHANHEPFYCVMPYLPLALFIAERYMTNGRTIWLALLALCLGLQWTLGHFQLQTWTGGLRDLDRAMAGGPGPDGSGLVHCA